jgi:hypothetical protein
MMSMRMDKQRVEGACASVKDRIARKKQCGGEGSELLKTEFRR